MSESISEKIDRFTKYNEDIIENIMSIYSHKNNGIHAKILFCSLFDSLTKCAYPEIKNNSQRFKKTITEHTQWTDADRVSITHLVRAFEITNEVPEEFSQLKEDINKLLQRHFNPSKYGISNCILINVDPLYSYIENIWPKNDKGIMLPIN